MKSKEILFMVLFGFCFLSLSACVPSLCKDNECLKSESIAKIHSSNLIKVAF